MEKFALEVDITARQTVLARMLDLQRWKVITGKMCSLIRPCMAGDAAAQQLNHRDHEDHRADTASSYGCTQHLASLPILDELLSRILPDAERG